MATKLLFTIVADRDWDYVKFSNFPAGHKFSPETMAKLAAKQIYWSFKRNMFYKKSRINSEEVKDALKGYKLLVRKGFEGYIAPTPKAKKTAPKPAQTAEVSDQIATLTAQVAALTKLVAKLTK